MYLIIIGGFWLVVFLFVFCFFLLPSVEAFLPKLQIMPLGQSAVTKVNEPSRDSIVSPSSTLNKLSFMTWC